MKKQRIIKIIAGLLALILLASCSSAGTGSISSVITEKENQNTIVSSETSKEETDSLPAVSDKDNTSSQRGDNTVVSKNPSTSDETSSKKDNTFSENSSNYEAGWVLKTAYIPEDNPSPIKIDKENAHIPTPISFTDEIIYGKLDFDIKTTKVSTDGWEWGNHIAILNSCDQLKEIWQTDQGKSYEREKDFWENHGGENKFDENDYYVNWYDEKFFEDNTLIMLFFNTGALPYRIDKVNVHNGRMYIYVNNRDHNGGILPTIAYTYRTFITVPNRYFDKSPAANLDKIKEIVVYKDVR